jgi:hypothetical protein
MSRRDIEIEKMAEAMMRSPAWPRVMRLGTARAIARDIFDEVMNSRDAAIEALKEERDEALELSLGVDPQHELRLACEAKGSQKAWAAAHGLSAAYVSDVLRGKPPGDAILSALCIVRVYQRSE